MTHHPTARIALATLLGSIALCAQASIVVSTSGITGATQTQTFASPSLASGALVTNQFAGLTISPTAGGAVRYNGCGAGFFGSELPSPNYIGTFGPGCQTNTVNDSFSMLFDQAVSGASFALRDYRGSGTSTFTALLNGAVVDTFVHDASSGSASGYILSNTGLYLNFTGVVFDEIRYTESSAGGGYVFLTNVAWTNASTGVPEPGTLALAGLALSALGAVRRRMG